MYETLTSCRLCHNTVLIPCLDLGEHVMSGVFPKTVAEDEALPRGPLKLARCSNPKCELVQLSVTYDLNRMYGKDYGYRSGLNPSMVRHLQQKAEKLRALRPMRRDSDVVIDIGSNDGTFLNTFTKDCIRIGFDPTAEKFQKYYASGTCIVAGFYEGAGEVTDRKARIITSIACFYDLPDPIAFARNVAKDLAPDGIWHFEQSYLWSMLSNNAYDTVCHEHLEYYGMKQILFILDQVGMRCIDVELNDVNGGSFAVTAVKGVGKHCHEALKMAALEECHNLETVWEGFSNRVERLAEDLWCKLFEAKVAGKRVFGLGASTKGNTLLQYTCGPEPASSFIQAIAEVNPDKFGCMTPGTRIPIVDQEHVSLRASTQDLLLVLPWHFRDGFLKNRITSIFNGYDTKLVVPMLFPLPRVEVVK